MKSLTHLRRQLAHNLPIFFALMLFELHKPWLMLKDFWALKVKKQDSLEYRMRQIKGVSKPTLHDKLFFTTIYFGGYLKRQRTLDESVVSELNHLMHPVFLACYATEEWRLDWIDILHGVLQDESKPSRVYFEALYRVTGLTRHRLLHLIGEQHFTQLEQTPLDELLQVMMALLPEPAAPDSTKSSLRAGC